MGSLKLWPTWKRKNWYVDKDRTKMQKKITQPTLIMFWGLNELLIINSNSKWNRSAEFYVRAKCWERYWISSSWRTEKKCCCGLLDDYRTWLPVFFPTSCFHISTCSLSEFHTAVFRMCCVDSVMNQEHLVKSVKLSDKSRRATGQRMTVSEVAKY